MFSITGTRKYRLQFAGVLDQDSLTGFCPPGVEVQVTGTRTTLTGLCADQAALIGILRCLHNLGCTLILVQVDGEPRAPGPEDWPDDQSAA